MMRPIRVHVPRMRRGALHHPLLLQIVMNGDLGGCITYSLIYENMHGYPVQNKRLVHISAHTHVIGYRCKALCNAGLLR